MIRAHSVLVLAITLLSVAGPAAAAALPSVLGERDSTTAHIVNLIAREEEKKGGISKTVKYILIAVGALVGIIILSVLAVSSLNDRAAVGVTRWSGSRTINL